MQNYANEGSTAAYINAGGWAGATLPAKSPDHSSKPASKNLNSASHKMSSSIFSAILHEEERKELNDTVEKMQAEARQKELRMFVKAQLENINYMHLLKADKGPDNLLLALRVTRECMAPKMGKRCLLRYIYNRESRKGRLQQDLKEMVKEFSIRQLEYGFNGVDDLNRIIQGWNNSQDFSTNNIIFKLFIFGETPAFPRVDGRSHYKPVFTSDGGQWNTPLILVWKEERFWGLRDVKWLFGQTRPYCLKCEDLVQNLPDHAPLPCDFPTGLRGNDGAAIPVPFFWQEEDPISSSDDEDDDDSIASSN
jgi:hypothetical protein